MLDNPIARAWYQLGGGWRQVQILVGLYLALVALVSYGAYRMAGPDDVQQTTGVLLAIVSALQGIFLLTMAPGAVHKAVQRDYQTKMLESHRLSPMRGITMALGYLLGPTAQAAALFTAGLFVGALLATWYGQTANLVGPIVGAWLFCQFCLLSAAGLLLVLALLTALASSGKVNILMMLIITSVLGGWILVAFVPGLALVFGVLTTGMLLQVLMRSALASGTDPAVMIWTLLTQVALTAVLLRACSRRLRLPDQPAFSIRLGLLLFVVSSVILVAGAYSFDGVSRLLGGEYTSAQWIGSCIAGLVIVLFPLYAAAIERAQSDRRLIVTGKSAPPVTPMDATALVVTVLMVVLAWLLDHTQRPFVTWWPSGMALAIVVLCSCWVDYAWMYAARRRDRSAFRALLLSAVLFKALPLVIDGVTLVLMEFTREPGMSAEQLAWPVSNLSPIGTFILAAQGRPSWVGVACQLLIAILALVVFDRRRRSGDLAARNTAAVAAPAA